MSNAIAQEYKRYMKSSVMQELAQYAHGEDYIGQTSSATFQEIVKYLEKCDPVKNVLDAGCGKGAFSYEIAKHFKCEVDGIDLSFDLISAALPHPMIHYTVGDFSSPENIQGEYDVILSIGSLYWNVPLETTIQLWKSRLNETGALLIFSNIQFEPLDPEEQSSIGHTQFIQNQHLMEVLEKEKLRLEECVDGTEVYEAWLKRWCQRMDDLSEQIKNEMGLEAAVQLQNRFKAYLSLAKSKKVKRMIFLARRLK